jgi:hypothetical protein
MRRYFLSTALFRRLGMYGTAVGIVIVIFFVKPSLVQAIGVDVWNLDQLHEDLKVNEEKSRQLDEKLDMTTRQSMVNNLLIQDVAAGRRALQETAQLMIAMNQSREDYMAGVMMTSHGRTPEAKMADKIISLVVLEVKTPTALIIHKLQAEFRRHYQ